MSFSNQKILLLIISVYFLSHLIGITDPANGYHAWRESDTAAVNESFAKETTNIFLPRIHQREDKSGITGMEFPIYNFTAGMIQRVLPKSALAAHASARMLSTLIGLLALLGIFKLGSKLFSERTGLFAAFFLLCSPLFFFYSRKIQPDIILVAASIWAVYYFLKAVEDDNKPNLIYSVLLASLASLIKPTALFIGVPFVYIIYRKNRSVGDLFKIKYIASGFVILALTFIWNSHAKNLQNEYGLFSFYLGGDMMAYWAKTNWCEFFHNIFVGWLSELFLGLGAMVGTVIGLIYLRKFEKNTGVVLSWILGAYIIFFFVSEHMSAFHDYYGFVAVPGLVLLAAYTFEKVIYSGNKFMKYFFSVLMVASAGLVYPRVQHRYGNYKNANFEQNRKVINKYIPADSRITIEDSSPAIELYRAGRFGWTFRPGAKPNVIEQQAKAGASYAVYTRSKPDSTIAANYTKIGEDGKLVIFELVRD